MKFYEKLKPSGKGYKVFNIDGKKVRLLESPVFVYLRDIAFLPDSENLAKNPKYLSKRELIKVGIEYYETRKFFDKSKPISSICENEIADSTPEFLTKQGFQPDELEKIKQKARILDKLWS